MATRPDGRQALKRGQVRRWHMLMIERDDVAPRAEREHAIGLPVIADLCMRAHLRGAVGCGIGEYAELDAETDRGLGRHPGKLAAAHHADDRLCTVHAP